MHLFSTGQSFSILADWHPPFWKCALLDIERDRLALPVTDEEISLALWSLKPSKAPGPDGLHAGFFQRYWLIVGESIKTEVKNIFSSGTVPNYLNKTLITLIPKCRSPESLNNYRPIGLCNTVYKLVTKIIVAKMRPTLSNFVSPLQTAFVPGRKGVDNAIIVQELIHTMSQKKGKEGFMAIKIDLEKAYDRLEWKFIKDTLTLFKFPTNLIALIMSCVTSSSISVLFNGGALDPFLPSRGIWQGYPLSPYLFILCMEILGAFITEKCDTKLWDPVKASQGGIAFSHLFFADDLVLFAKADQKNCLVIRDALDSFCDLSGQKISNEKSRVFFSPNVSPLERERFCDILGFRSTPYLGKYLGFPIKHTSVPHDFSFILERVQNKQAGWKAHLLSFAGRLVLTQSVTLTIPNYVMQCLALPPKILNNIDRLSRNFLLGHSDNKKKLHLVSWKKITKTKKEGGLGLHEAKAKNIALLAKLNWRMHREKESLWARVLSHKYNLRRRRSSLNPKTRLCSTTWSAIKKGDEVFN